MQISYDYYRVFYYVAKYRSFTLAASALLSNQPNVTRIIKNLESELNCILFVRSNRGVSLTPEGKKLFAHVSVAFEQIQAGEEELSLEKCLQSGSVSIGASETALHSFLLPILRRFHKCYPGIRIKVSNHSTPQAVTALKNGLVDLAVVTTPTGVRKPFHEIPLKNFREIPICGLDLQGLCKNPISLKNLINYPFICLEKETKTYKLYNDLFLRHGLEFHPDIEVATADQILLMVKNDLGIGFVAETLAAEELQNQKAFELKLSEPFPKRAVCLVKRTDRSLSTAASEFEKMLMTFAESDQKQDMQKAEIKIQ